MIYLITGQPGTGKSTIAVEHAINRYLAKGRRVVANFPIDVSAVSVSRSGTLARASVRVIPDRPSRGDLDEIGFGCESQREEDFGLLIIDEAGVWLSARTWNGSQREEIIDWLSQSRKRAWDIIIIAQGPEMIDKQVRTSICEGIARLRRTDRLKVMGMSLPRMHVATVRYGLDANAPVIERWFYRGGDAHKCFGSYRLFGTDNGHYSVLPATLTKWRYIPVPRGARFYLAALRSLLGWVFRGRVPAGYEVNRFGRLVPVGSASKILRPKTLDGGRRGPQWRPVAAAVRDAFMQSSFAEGASGRP